MNDVLDKREGIGCNIPDHVKEMRSLINCILKTERLIIPLGSGTIFSWNVLGELTIEDYDYICEFFQLRKKHFCKSNE